MQMMMTMMWLMLTKTTAHNGAESTSFENKSLTFERFKNITTFLIKSEIFPKTTEYNIIFGNKSDIFLLF